jgi:hypothetical protein
MSIPPDRYWVPKTVLTVAGWCGERWGRRQHNMKMWNGSFIFCSEMLQKNAGWWCLNVSSFKSFIILFVTLLITNIINCYPLVGGWSVYGLGMTRDPFFRDGWLNHQDLQPCFAVHPVPGSEPQSLQLLKVGTLILLRSVNGSVRGDFLCLKCLLAKIERWTRQGEYYRLSGSVSPSIRATRACLWCCFGWTYHVTILDSSSKVGTSNPGCSNRPGKSRASLFLDAAILFMAPCWLVTPSFDFLRCSKHRRWCCVFSVQCPLYCLIAEGKMGLHSI